MPQPTDNPAPAHRQPCRTPPTPPSGTAPTARWT